MVCTECVAVVVASSTAVSDAPNARRLGQASMGMSITGIVLSVIAGIVAAVVIVVVIGSAVSDVYDAYDAYDSYDSCRYTYGGNCYMYRKSYSSYTYSYCTGVIGNGYCYYN